MDRLLGAAKELQVRHEALVRVGGVAEWHDVDAAVASAVVDKPANDGQPLWAGVTQLALRLGLRVRDRRGGADWRADTHESLADLLEVLGAPGAEALILHEVVIHRRLAIIPEVQHAGLLVEKAARVLKQTVEVQKALAVRRQFD